MHLLPGSSVPAIKIKILFEDQHLVAIHKPAGIAFHGDATEEGIVQLVRKMPGYELAYPVHRLDKITSGLMIFAKHKEANVALSQLLASKQLEKYYLAVTAKKPNRKQGLISGDMEKGRRGSYLLKRDKSNPAITRFFAKPLNSLVNSEYELQSTSLWLYALKPETGKTHQLRVALKSLASPVLGDARYGADEADRGYLHAYKMRFELFGERYQINDPNFSGERFDFSWLSEASIFIQPETLPWPKGAYKLAANAP